jgi:hypothetical protein
MAIYTNKTTIIGGALNGSYEELSSLPTTIQKIINDFSGLVLIREKEIDGKRVLGTLWSGGEILCFAVEDITRNKKIDKKTSIPDTISSNTTDLSTLSTINPANPGAYYITLDTTGNTYIAKSYVKFPGEPKPLSSPGVAPRIGTSKEGSVLEGKEVNAPKGFGGFTGVRIHQGRSEVSSEGCIIVSRTRKHDGTLELDLECAKNITKFIYKNKYYNGKHLVVINAWEFPQDPSPSELKGMIINDSTGEAIKNAKIVYPDIEPFPLQPLETKTAILLDNNPQETLVERSPNIYYQGKEGVILQESIDDGVEYIAESTNVNLKNKKFRNKNKATRWLKKNYDEGIT